MTATQHHHHPTFLPKLHLRRQIIIQYPWCLFLAAVRDDSGSGSGSGGTISIYETVKPCVAYDSETRLDGGPVRRATTKMH
ncbi:hypothetical protein M0802_002578 [Mischocyttarus mexicanus]|nr:hypothetical protein M0802_002578 [Mischocyttarus mexicanus]